MTDPNLQPMKLHARNLTARAAAVVRGNPVTTRPEDGVENCFPGLEFDQRNLDKVFLPGLSLEWHHGGGVIVRDFDPAGIAAGLITAADIAGGLFLIAVRGVFASRLEAVAPAPDVRFVLPPAGLDAWRVVRDIEPGESRRQRMAAEALAVAGPLSEPMAEMENHADPAIRELALRMQSRAGEMTAAFTTVLDRS